MLLGPSIIIIIIETYPGSKIVFLCTDTRGDSKAEKGTSCSGGHNRTLVCFGAHSQDQDRTILTLIIALLSVYLTGMCIFSYM